MKDSSISPKNMGFWAKSCFLLSKTSVFLHFLALFSAYFAPFRTFLNHFFGLYIAWHSALIDTNSCRSPTIPNAKFTLADVVLLFQIYTRLQPLAIGLHLNSLSCVIITPPLKHFAPLPILYLVLVIPLSA